MKTGNMRVEERAVKEIDNRRNRSMRQSVTQAAIACAGVAFVAGCATAPRPVEPEIAKATMPPPPIIIVQPVKPEPPVPVTPPPVEQPPQINQEAEEALAVLVDLQKLAFAAPDEQKREIAAATQVLARQRSDAARLRLGMLQSLPAGGADETRALATLDPVLKQGNGPTRMVAALLMAQLTERQRAVREEKKRSDDLQQKLEALKALERSLLGRERKPASTP
jgi:hypothetical protein